MKHPSQMHELTIRIYYPAGSGRIALRTEHDWDRNLESVNVGAHETYSEFVVSSEGLYFYFKPVLIDRETLRWSRGANYLALMNPERVLDIYPYFVDDESTVSEPIEVHAVHTAEKHPIRVFYPPGYRENTLKRFPVLYMHDGQNLFFQQEAFAGEHWRVEETLSILDTMNIIRRAIVIGIYPVEREKEYTKPGYEQYGRFIVEDLKPVIDRAFRTLSDAPNTAVMGSSLGGVVSFYLAWQWPEVFGKAACMSSTFDFRDDLMERVRDEPKRDVKIYLDSGWPGDNYEVTRGMQDLLVRRGFVPGRDLLYFAFPEAVHNERYWAMRSHIPYQFFFAR